MATPTDFTEKNDVLKAPKGEENCLDLPIFRCIDSNKVPYVVSAWKLTREELWEVQRTGIVYIGIVGFTHPPMWVSGFMPDSTTTKSIK